MRLMRIFRDPFYGGKFSSDYFDTHHFRLYNGEISYIEWYEVCKILQGDRLKSRYYTEYSRAAFDRIMVSSRGTKYKLLGPRGQIYPFFRNSNGAITASSYYCTGSNIQET